MRQGTDVNAIGTARRPSRPMFYFGLDLGQMSDSTALAVIQYHEPDYSVPAQQYMGEMLELRHIEVVPLQTAYDRIVAGVRTRMMQPAFLGRSELVIDAGGVGRAVLDIFKASGMRPVAVTITGGEKAQRTETGEWHVPKRDLIAGLQVLLQSRPSRLQIAPGIPHADEFMKQMLAFKMKIDPKTAHDSYEGGGGVHDDIVLAVALACWRARNRPRAEAGRLRPMW